MTLASSISDAKICSVPNNSNLQL